MSNYYFILFLFIIILIIFSIKKNNIPLLCIGLILFFLLLPTIIVYTGIYYSALMTILSNEKSDQIWNNNIRNLFTLFSNTRLINQKTYNTPVIYCANHYSDQDYMDSYIISYLENSKIVAYTKKGLTQKILKKIGFIEVPVDPSSKIKSDQNNNSFDLFIKNSAKAVENGYNVVLFPEGKYSDEKATWKKLTNFQSGAFILSKELNIPIVPVVFDRCSYLDFIVPNKQLDIHFLEPLYPNEYKTSEEMRVKTLFLMNEKLSQL